MKKVTTVASVLKLEATAELKKEVEKELAIADPVEFVNLEELCSDCNCKGEPNGK